MRGMFQFGALLMLGAACLCIQGCGPREYRLPETGVTLEGTVMLGDKPVPAAVIIVAGDQGGATGKIGADGRYKVENAPLGAVKIAVNTEAAKGQMMGEMMARSVPGSKGEDSPAAPAFLDVPKQFWDPETSGITITLQKGVNAHNIVLTES